MDRTVRALLSADDVTHVPGVWDPASAALAVRAGNRAVLLSGAAVAATLLGSPDLGLVPATQIADRAAVLRPALAGVPLLADADAGYRDPRYAVWTALAYQRAGITGLIIGDLRDPAVSSVELAHESQAVARIAALTSEAPDMVVIARTDAYRGGSLRAVAERCRAYAAAGADAVLPWGVEDRSSLAELRAALPGVRLVAARTDSAPATPPATDLELARMDVHLVLHPMTALLAALRAASLAYRSLSLAGENPAEPIPEVDRLPLAALAELTSPRPADTPTAPIAFTQSRFAPSPTRLPRTPSRRTPGHAHVPAQGSSLGGIMQRIDRLDT